MKDDWFLFDNKGNIEEHDILEHIKYQFLDNPKRDKDNNKKIYNKKMLFYFMDMKIIYIKKKKKIIRIKKKLMKIIISMLININY